MKQDIKESIIFFIISLIAYLYYKYNNPNQVIERYLKEHSKTEYYLLKYSIIFLKLIMLLNFKYLVVFSYNKFYKKIR